VDQFAEGLDDGDHTGDSVRAVECGLDEIAHGIPGAAGESAEQSAIEAEEIRLWLEYNSIP
jgi:hypothetical protein